jgi:photosystem II stability/assembly factor-like uncharacterized protein
MRRFFKKRQPAAVRLPAIAIGYIFCWICLTNAVSYAEGDPNDFLTMPAVMSNKVVKSKITDVVNTGEALVAVGERGYILVSKDHGSSWTQSPVPVSVTLTAVDFPTARHGWAVGHQGVILHSSDGGQTWEKQIDGSVVNDMMLKEARRLLEKKTVEAEAASEDLKDALDQELDDLNFFVDDWTVAAGEGPSAPLMDVCFINEQEGLVAGSFGMVFKTMDGGNTWMPIINLIPNFSGKHYYGIARCGGSVYITGEAGMIIRSDNGGISWKQLDSPYEGSFFGITCVPDGSMILVYGLRGHVFRSLDGGQSWQSSEIENQITFQGGRVFKDGSVWLATTNGTIFRSDDAGKSFDMLKTYACARPVCSANIADVTMIMPVTLPQQPPGAISIADSGDGAAVVVGLAGITRVTPNILKMGE